MKKIYLLGMAFMLCFSQMQAQDCSNGRYADEIFTDFTLTSDILYGNNDRYNGDNIDLFVDVREPEGDTETNRPLIIIAHGGSFLGGSKTGSDVVPLAEEFAKKGYVTASISYRIGMNGIPFPGPDDSDASEAVMRATQDARAAVRFFRRSVAEDGNPYGIDPNHIYMAGVSAGGFMALHLAYLDEDAKIPPFIDTTEPGLAGGVLGESGNPGYPSTVNAIINMAGALGDVDWMEADATPVLSLHGDDDNTVPFYTEMITLLGTYDIMVVDGSHTIHTRAQELGMVDCFKPFWGADHVPHVNNADYYDTTATYMTDFLLHFVCDQEFSEDCYKIDGEPNSVTEISEGAVQLFPNPADNHIFINLSDMRTGNVRVFDLTGKLVHASQFNKSGQLSVDVSAWKSGMYILQVETDNFTTTKKFVVR